MLLCPPGVHPHQHLGEVGRIDTAGAGPDRDQRLADVVLAGQEGADLERLDGLVDLAQLDLGVLERRGVALLLTELDHDLQVVDPAGQLGDPVDLALEGREPAGDAGGVLLVVPEVGCGDLDSELADLLAHRVEVEHLLDGAHGRLELLYLGVEVGSCHEGQVTRGTPARGFVRRGPAAPSSPGLRRVRSCRAPAGCRQQRCRCSAWR